MTLPFFLEMALKSAVIAAAGLLLAGALRRRSAADRAAVLRLAIALLLLLPVLSSFLPALQVEVAREVRTAPAPGVVSDRWIPSALVQTPGAGEAAGIEPSFSVFDDPGILIAIAYLGGLLMAAARLAAGLWTLRGWTGSAEPLRDPEWTMAFERIRAVAGLGDNVRLLLSNDAPAPLSWGWRRPVILIDADTARRPEDAEAILEHEVAHILRSDWPALIVARAASAIFWFNPLVWAVERSLVQNTEEAADSCVLGRVEPARYARVLLGCADQLCRAAIPANSMTGSASIGRRIRAVLDGSFRDARPGSALALVAMACCVAFAGPVAAMKFVALTVTQAAPAAWARGEAPVAAAAPARVVVQVEDAIADAVAASVEAAVDAALDGVADAAAEGAEAAAPAVAAQLAAVIPPTPAHQPAPAPLPPTPAAMPTPPGPPVPPGPPPGLLDVDALVAMKIHGVSSGFLSELAALGPRYARLPVDKVVEMRIHGVTPRFIREMAQAGYPGLSTDQLVSMRIHGVTDDLARRATARLGRRPTAEDLVTIAIHGLD